MFLDMIYVCRNVTFNHLQYVNLVILIIFLLEGLFKMFRRYIYLSFCFNA